MSELIEKLEALEKQSQKLYEESRAHMKKWQGDREIIMRLVLGYEYKNRVDDPEWEKALSILRALIASAHTPPGDGGLREAPSSEESLARLTFNSDGEEIGREMAKRIIAAMRNDYHLLYTMLHPNAFAALGRPAEASARDEKGGWHDTTPPPAEEQRIMASVKLCTCEIITGGQMVDDPACLFHHPPAPSETGKKPPEDFAIRSEGTSAPKRWKCKGCDLVGGEIGEMIVGPDGTLIHWDEKRWCGPVEPTGEGVGT